MTDGNLLSQHLEGNRTAFAILHQKYTLLVRRIAQRVLYNPADSDDVAQAVFLLLLKKAPKLVSHPSIAGWLLVTTRHVSLTFARAERRRRKHELAFAGSSPLARGETVAVSPQAGRNIEGVLSKLKASDREVLTLRFLMGMSNKQVARACGISEVSSRKRIRRALNRAEKIFGSIQERLTSNFVGPSARDALRLQAVLAVSHRTLPSTFGRSAFSTRECSRTARRIARQCGTWMRSRQTLDRIIGFVLMIKWSTPRPQAEIRERIIAVRHYGPKGRVIASCLRHRFRPFNSRGTV